MFLAESLADFIDLVIKLLNQDLQFFVKDILQYFSKLGFSPTKTLAHNGEINTLKGNVNWMKFMSRIYQVNF